MPSQKENAGDGLFHPVNTAPPTRTQGYSRENGLPAEASGKQGGRTFMSELTIDGQSGLVDILAEMLRSALVWEEEHGFPPSNSPS